MCERCAPARSAFTRARAVSKHASEADIRKAYKRLSRKYHPDKNKEADAEKRFVEIAHGESAP